MAPTEDKKKLVQINTEMPFRALSVSFPFVSFYCHILFSLLLLSYLITVSIAKAGKSVNGTTLACV
jgi:hypothetical protein